MDNQDKCTICLQDFTEMYSLKLCNHSFCKECISKYVSFNLRNLKCPLCRSYINITDVNAICPEFYEELNYTDRLLVENDLDLMEELEMDRQIESYLEQQREIQREIQIEEYFENFMEDLYIESYLEHEREIEYERKLMEDLEIEYLEHEREIEYERKLMEDLEIEYLEHERQLN